MALADSQKISRVLKGKPFGDGSGGNATVSAHPTYGRAAGASGQKIVTSDVTAFADDDVVLIHQTRGVGAGNYEINRVASGGGTTSLTMQENLANAYTTCGQLIKVVLYDELTINAFTVTAWNGLKGGLVVFAGKTSITTGGALNGSGSNGTAGVTATGASGGGFRGGNSKGNAARPTGTQGESYGGAGGSSYSANGGGGGAGSAQTANGSDDGGGAGYAGVGTKGTEAGVYGGLGGGTYGTAALTTIHLGSGGGGAARSNDEGNKECGSGGSGGGLVVLISKDITLTSGVTVNGGNGGDSGGWNGGGGSGGSILLQCATSTLGTAKATATGGTGTTASVGRIAVHHSGTVTGTTSPTFSDTTDDTLVESTSGGAFLLSQFV